MTSKGGMTGVHQVRFWWNDHSGLEIEEAEFISRLPEKLTRAQMDARKRSEIVKAFHAKCPDVLGLSKQKKKEIIDTFLNGRKWKKIVNEILKE
jgi:hypothetical protein